MLQVGADLVEESMQMIGGFAASGTHIISQYVLNEVNLVKDDTPLLSFLPGIHSNELNSCL